MSHPLVNIGKRCPCGSYLSWMLFHSITSYTVDIFSHYIFWERQELFKPYTNMNLSGDETGILVDAMASDTLVSAVARASATVVGLTGACQLQRRSWTTDMICVSRNERKCKCFLMWLEIPHFMMTSSNGDLFRVTGHLCREFTGQLWSFDIFFDMCPNNRLSKQSWGWWFETPSHPLWRHCNMLPVHKSQ